MLCLLLRFACIFSFVNHIAYGLLIRCQVLNVPRWRNEAKGGVVALLLGGAVADTVAEYNPWDRGVAISLGLALAHVCVAVLGRGARWCCTFECFFSWLGCMD